jgi:galactokinase
VTPPPGAAPTFTDLFGAPPEVRAAAPGRVNVIGEHTDYNGGFVLPAAIPQHTTVELRRSPGLSVEVWSRDIAPGGERNGYTLGSETPQHGWLDYVSGITDVLASAGHRVGGFQLRIESDIPVGSGLSSSAALEISVLRALREAFSLRLSDVELALIGQRVENEFVGAPVGIMDQMACSMTGDGAMLFLDTRSLIHERIPLPGAASLIVINSGVAHSHAGGDYRTRREECTRAAALLGVTELRDVRPSELSRVAALPSPLDRRARHVVTENQRVLDTVAAFRAGDLEAVGALLSSSHASMRDDFEVSVPEIDLLVTIAERQRGVYGARLTGGGFGGSIVGLAPLESARRSGELISAEYSRLSGRTSSVLVPSASSGH